MKNKLVAKCLPVAVALVPLSVAPMVADAMVSIVVSGTADLNFGSMTAGTAGGTVTISTAGARSKTGSLVLLTGAGLESNAVLSISGSTGVLIDVDMTVATFALTGAGAPMNVSTFDINGSGSGISVTLTTNPATFPIGGTLTVAAGQAAGAYSGTYTVSANYQ